MIKYTKALTLLMLAVTLTYSQSPAESRLVSTLISQQKKLFLDDSLTDNTTLYSITIGNRKKSYLKRALLTKALKEVTKELEYKTWQHMGYSKDEAKLLTKETSLFRFNKQELVSKALSKHSSALYKDTTSMDIHIDIKDIPTQFTKRFHRNLPPLTEIPKSVSLSFVFKFMQPTLSLGIHAKIGTEIKETTITDTNHLIGYFSSIEVTEVNSNAKVMSSNNKTKPKPRSSYKGFKRIFYGGGGVGLDAGWWRENPRIAPTVQGSALHVEISPRSSLQTFGFIDGRFHISIGGDTDKKKLILDFPTSASYGLGVGYNIFSLGFIGQESYYNFSTLESNNEGLFRGGFYFGAYIPFRKDRGLLIQPIAGWYASKNRMFGVFKAPETDKINNYGGHMELILKKKRITLDYSRVIAYHLENQADGIGHIIQGRYTHHLKNDDIITLNITSNNWVSDLRESNLDLHVSYIKGIF